MHPAFFVSEYFGLIAMFAIIVFILSVALTTHFRQGRNEVLEEWIALGKCGPATSFEGTLNIEENRPGFLRLSKSTDQAKRLQFQYRWLSAVREQAGYDEVIFDGSRAVVDLRKKDRVSILPFAKFSAVRMRELSQSEAGSLWHFDLVAAEGKNVLFATSARGNRRLIFENSAGLAKAISAITSLPVQVVVSGNVWTPGWPPKNSMDA
jgi:hypothetical protein